jgi:hypothetical protein
MVVLLDEPCRLGFAAGEQFFAKDQEGRRMPGNASWEFEQPGDELRDEEYPDVDPDEDDPDEESTPTVSCAHCGAEVFEDAFQCPVCGAYLTGGSADSHLWSGRPGWWIVLGLLGILAVVAVLVLASN